MALISTVGLSFVAGLLSFLSPCVLPLVPAYLGFLTGSFSSDQSGRPPRGLALRHSASFVIGFGLTFQALWLALAIVGYQVADIVYRLRPVAGIALVLLGLHLAGMFSVGMLYRTFQLKFPTGLRPGYFRSFLAGILFAAAWTPCVGPMLAAIVVLAATRGTMGEGAFMLLAYSIGLAVPFMAAAFAIGTPTRVTGWMKRRVQLVQTGAGMLVVLLGLLVLSGTLSRLARPEWITLPELAG